MVLILEVAATLMTKGLTTFYLLHKTFPVKSGQTILISCSSWRSWSNIWSVG
jgi:NADPH2:quinone reductase